VKKRKKKKKRGLIYTVHNPNKIAQLNSNSNSIYKYRGKKLCLSVEF
jgi:hypothetical protein